MPRNFGHDFREQQYPTRYPFADTASLVASSGQPLDHDMFADASLYPVGNTLPLHLAEISIAAEQATIVIANSRSVPVASGTVELLNPVDNVQLVDLNGVDAGVLVSDSVRLSRFSSWNQGQHSFPAGNANFVASCVIPVPATGVHAVQLEDGTLLQKDIWLVGENGVVFRPDPDDENVIRMDVVGDPLFRRRLCEPIALFTTPRFIKTINGCPPDQYGDFQFTVGNHINASTIVRIYPDGDGQLVIEAVGDTTT